MDEGEGKGLVMTEGGDEVEDHGHELLGMGSYDCKCIAANTVLILLGF